MSTPKGIVCTPKKAIYRVCLKFCQKGHTSFGFRWPLQGRRLRSSRWLFWFTSVVSSLLGFVCQWIRPPERTPAQIFQLFGAGKRVRNQGIAEILKQG